MRISRLPTSVQRVRQAIGRVNVPFVYVAALGIHITENEVYWNEVRRFRDCMCVMRFGQETIGENGVESALRSLVQSLNIARIHRSLPRVCTHVDPAYLRHVIVEAPVFEDEEILSQWLSAEICKLLPPGAREHEFVAGIQGLRHMEDKSRYLLVLARRSAIEERMALLENVGLVPVVLGSPYIESRAEVEITIASAASAVLYAGEEAVVLKAYEDSVLRSFMEIGGEDIPGILDETEHVLLSETDFSSNEGLPELQVTGSRAEVMISEADPHWLGRIHLIRPLAGVLATGASLPPAYAAAASLVLAGLYGEQDGINLLEPSQSLAGQQEVEKRDAIRIALSTACVVMLILLVFKAADFYVDARLRQAHAELAPLAEHVQAVEDSKVTLAQARANLAHAERLALERTGAAGLLEVLGQAMPTGVWLREMVLSAETVGTPELTLRGLATGEGDLSHFLYRLEQTESFREVQLVFAETVSRDKVFRETGTHQVPLIHFETKITTY
jgi:Tfp pilus assembly protein PilN